MHYGRDARQREVDEELRFHLEERVEELIGTGLTPAAARARAHDEFGDVADVRRGLLAIDTRIHRRRRQRELLTLLLQDLRFAVRRLLRSPGFTLATILTLALGIGAVTGVFGVVDAVALRSLPYAESGQLVRLNSAVPGIDQVWGVAKGQVLNYARESDLFAAFGVYRLDGASVRSGSSGEAAYVRTAQVSQGVAAVLAAHPSFGRLLREEDARDGSQRVALLTYRYWQVLGGDTAILGKSLDLNGQPHDIVGVLADDVRMPEEVAYGRDVVIDIWLPMSLDPAEPARNTHVYQGIARLRPGVEVATATADLARLTERFPESLPSAYNARFMEETQFTPRLTPLHEDVVGGAARVLWILLGGVAIVLVITCANVANLFLVRAETRRKEMAVRSVLGAGRADLARHRLSETLLISCLACVLGVGVAWSGMRLLVQAAPAGIPRLSEISLRMPALLFALGVSLVLGVVFGVAPSRRGAPVLDLADMSRGTTPSARRRAVRNGLIVAQVALCFALLAGAGLLLRSFDRLTDVEPGFSPDGVLTFRVVLPYDRYPDADRSTTFDRILSERIEDLPGVVAVGAGASVPLGGVGGCTTVLPLAPARADQKSECLYPEYITPGYFRALDIPVQGHEPTWSEIQAGARVAVISASMARRFWGDTNVLGREIRVPDGFAEAYRIVGVVDDIRNEALDAPSLETIYVPLFPAPPWGRLGGPAFFVKTDLENPTTLVPAIRQALAELDASVPLVRPQSMHTIVVTSMGRLTFTATLLSVAAFMALMVGTVGIYGVVSYTVSQRRAEIGVRVALGAQGTQVRRMIIVETLRVALFGIVAGLLVALPLGRTLESLLYGVSPADPLTLGIVAVALLLVAAAAGWAPATLALRVDPLEALRSG